ncbi:MAG: hypothetical protein JO091_10635, partial [Acidobacteriaceae bacterium]|nr:hypothetical protein [Acidobacteriaceae bacterium]
STTLALRLRTDVLSPNTKGWDLPTDHHKYMYIAEHAIGSFHIQPACWRIGAPLLTRALPFSTYRSFDVLSVLFLSLCGLMIYLWLRAVPRPHAEAMLGVILFYSLGAASKLLLQGVVSPDPASYFFILVALYAIYKGNDFLCAAALALGVLTKETVALAGPLFYSLKATRLWDASRFKRFLLVFAPCVCILVAVRILIPAWNDRDDYVQSLPFIYTQVSAGQVKYDLKTAFLGTIDTYRAVTSINLVRLFSYGSLGLQLFLPFFALGPNKQVLLRWAPYWIPILASLLIALNADRRLGSLFPVLIVMGLNGVGQLGAKLNAGMADFCVIFSLQLLLLLLSKDVQIVPFDLAAAVFLLSLAWLVARERQRTVPV